MKNIHSIVYSLIILFLISCAPTQTYIDQSIVSEDQFKLSKIIILHLGGIYENRQIIEDELTYWINQKGYNAYPSYRYFPGRDLPNREELATIIKENGFDGILITKVKNIDVRERYENTQQRYATSPSEPVFYNYLDSYKNQFSTGYSFLERNYVIDIELHAVKEEKLIYKSTAETRASESLDQVVEDFSKSIAKNLKRSDLLKEKD